MKGHSYASYGSGKSSMQACSDAHATVVLWASWSDFITNSIVLFLLAPMVRHVISEEQRVCIQLDCVPARCCVTAESRRAYCLLACGCCASSCSMQGTSHADRHCSRRPGETPHI